jgi:hypothetical protein
MLLDLSRDLDLYHLFLADNVAIAMGLAFWVFVIYYVPKIGYNNGFKKGKKDQQQQEPKSEIYFKPESGHKDIINVEVKSDTDKIRVDSNFK